MSKFKPEFLVTQGVTSVTDKGGTYFVVSDLKKKLKNIELNKADIIDFKNEDESVVQVIRACDIREKKSEKSAKISSKKVEEIVVKEPEVVIEPCAEGCGCVMTQEECEKALKKIEEE